MKFTALQIKEAARDALDNWDFRAISDGGKQRRVLQNIVRKGGFPVEYSRGFTDVFDWLAEYASATAAYM